MIDKKVEHAVFGGALIGSAPIAYLNARNLYRIEPNKNLKNLAKALKYVTPAFLLGGGAINIAKALKMKKAEMTKTAFYDELEKISLNLSQARALHRATIAPVLIRRGLNVERTMIENTDQLGYGLIPAISMKPSSTGKMKAVRKNLPESMIDAVKNNEASLNHLKMQNNNLHSRIYQPKGGVIKYVDNIFKGVEKHPRMTIEKKEYAKNIRNIIKKMSPQEKEMTNRISLMHERNELSIPDKKSVRFSSHMSPVVLARENNAVTSLGPEFSNVKSFYSTLRGQELTGYGSGRYSRPSQRAMVSAARL